MFTKIYAKIKDFIKDNYKGLLVILIIFLVFNIELPYSIYTPGGAVNLNDRINIRDSYNPKGSFNMAYVSMVKGSFPFVLISKIIPDWDLVKKTDLMLEGENTKEMVEREKLYLQESIDSATINAYKKAGKEIEITKISNSVSLIVNDAKTDLKIGDNIIKVNDKEVNSLAELKEVVSAIPENTKVNLKIIRDGREKDAYAITYKSSDGIKIGVSVITTYEYSANPSIEIKSKASEMGSSGGLMMSLTIYNKLTEKDITKGKKIVGTGTIDINGNIGEIGGVKYKLIGAVKNEADIFICPEENYKEAIKVAKDKDYDLKIISAKTFDEVLKKLEAL